jgi:hypothetical protein
MRKVFFCIAMLQLSCLISQENLDSGNSHSSEYLKVVGGDWVDVSSQQQNDGIEEKSFFSRRRGHRGFRGHGGHRGEMGHKGKRGEKGRRGRRGATGRTGAQGRAGATGADGLTGATGATGPDGATGAIGPTGAIGATGAIGPTGATGATGSTGATGMTGTTGAAGMTGATGLTGTTGPTGPVGIGIAQTYGLGAPTAGFSFTASSASTAYNAALLNTVPLGTGASTSDVTFLDVSDQFQINSPGNYLITYGLACEGSTGLMEGYYGESSGTPHLATSWVAVEKNNGSGTEELGAVPLAVTMSLINGANSGSQDSPQMLSGYGQMIVALQQNDLISLKVYVNAGYNTGSSFIRLSPDSITGGTPLTSINSGGTLSLVLIP